MELSSVNVTVSFLIKETKEEEMTEEEKAAQKARPVATNPIPGTPWYAHHSSHHLSSPLCWKKSNTFFCFLLLSLCMFVCVCLSMYIRCVVWTGDDRVFFYNPTTRLSMWDRPEELVGRADVDKHIQEPPHKRGLEDGKKTGVDKHMRSCSQANC